MVKNSYLELIDDCSDFVNNIDIRSSHESELNELEQMLTDYWKRKRKIVRNRIKNMGTEGKLNALYWGDLSPKSTMKFISRASLYVDSILIEDPFLRSFNLPSGFNSKFIMKVLKEQLNEIQKLNEWIADGLVIIHSPELNRSNTTLWSITEETDPVCENIEGLDDSDPRKFALGSSRDELIENTMRDCNSLNAVSYTDSFSSWNSLMKQINNDNMMMKKILSESFLFKAVEDVPLKFLDDVPIDIAREIRNKGFLDDLRFFFREHFFELRKAIDFNDYKEILEDCSYNIKREIKRHEREWKQIKQTVSFKIPLYSLIAAGSLSAVTTFDPTAISALVGGISGSIAIDSVQELEKYKRIQQNPVHILFKIKKKRNKNHDPNNSKRI